MTIFEMHGGYVLNFSNDTFGQFNGIDPKSADRIETILDMLDKATGPEDMDLPGFGFHRLNGSRSHQYAVEIRAQWRIVFEWEEGRPVRVDEEDYHGK